MAYASGRTQLLNAAAAGNGAETAWHGGRGVFSVVSLTGSGTVKLQWSPDFDATTGAGVTWLDVGSDTTLTAAGAGGFELPPCRIRAVSSGFTVASAYAHTTGPI